MNGVHSTCGEKQYAERRLVGTPEGKRPLGRRIILLWLSKKLGERM
jgi:hypothetical protein